MPLKGKDQCLLWRGANSLFLGSFFQQKQHMKGLTIERFEESHLFQIKFRHFFSDITVSCFKKIKSSKYSHQPFEGISKKTLGFLGKGILPQDAQKKQFRDNGRPETCHLPHLPTSGGALFYWPKKTSDLRGWNFWADCSPFHLCPGRNSGFSGCFPVKQNWVAVGGSLKTTTGCAVQKKHGTFPPNMGNSRFLAMVNSTGSGDESLRNKCEFESYLLLLTWSSRHTSSRSPQELSYQTHPLGMSNSCALVPCVIGNKTKETAGYQSVSFLWNWIHWSPRNEGPVKKSSTIFLWNIRSFFVFCPNDQFCCGCV